MELHDRIKQCRQNVGLTQEQVAEAMNVSRQAVTKWENGKSAPSTENLFKLASLFGTTVDFLLPEHEDRQLEMKKKKRYLILRSVLFTVIWYLLVFLIGFCVENIGLVERKYLIYWLALVQRRILGVLCSGFGVFGDWLETRCAFFEYLLHCWPSCWRSVWAEPRRGIHGLRTLWLGHLDRCDACRAACRLDMGNN